SAGRVSTSRRASSSRRRCTTARRSSSTASSGTGRTTSPGRRARALAPVRDSRDADPDPRPHAARLALPAVRGAAAGVPAAARQGDELPPGSFETKEPGVIFDRPTRYLRKLQGHVTVLEPGAGYDAHADAYDVAIVVLEGEVETIGGRAAPHDAIFYRAGEPHG